MTKDTMADQQEKPRSRFSHAALVEATAAAVRAAEVLQGRPVVRGVTIDGPTSKDLDDALWLESDPQGGYRLQVSIADVGSLITPHVTPTLEKEVFRRSFTRYFAEGNTPMLPRQLSEGSLSLLEGQPRPALTLSIPLDAELHPGEPSISQTSITSSKRFSYDEVDKEIEHPRSEFAPMLQAAFRVAQGLLQLRRAKGALAIYDLYAGWVTTEEGVLIKLAEGEQHKAHILIQECMVLANQAVALYLAERGLLALYRNHAAKVIAPARAALLEMIDSAVTHPEQGNPERVKTTVNLALERAKYGPTVEGHFGLNVPAYMHATSPLRRYPDLVNQHILHALLQGEPSPYTRSELEAIAAHVNAEEATIKDAKRAHFLAVYDEPLRRTITEAARTRTTRPLEGLDTKQFHSAMRIAAESHVLLPTVEQEILRRLEEQTLQAHDIFTLVFRFQNTGEAWERVKQASLQWLQSNPYHAVSILMMGQQALRWGEPVYKSEGPDLSGIFRARATLRIEGRLSTSSLHAATQKDLAKQLASAELLAKVAGIELASTTAEAQEAIPAQKHIPASVQEAPEASLSDSHNYKGLLQELAHAQKWARPHYREGERSGPAHAPTFTVGGTITIDGRIYVAEGMGNTKAQAEHAAARSLLQLLPQSVGQKTGPSAMAGKNAVSVLHEMEQRQEISSATYTYELTGPSHAVTITCTCVVTTPDGRNIVGTATGKSKKEATQGAALEVFSGLFPPVAI